MQQGMVIVIAKRVLLVVFLLWWGLRFAHLVMEVTIRL